MSARGSALAVHKETITPERALAIVKTTLEAKFKEAKNAAKAGMASIDKRVGGQTESLDVGCIDQGRAWAQRLALIARRNAGSNYSPNKTSIALQAEVKKIFAVVASLDAIVANDVEIPLFANVDEGAYFGTDDLRKLSKRELADIVSDVAADAVPDENPTVSFVYQLTSDLGDDATQAVEEALAGYTVAIPGREPTPAASKKASRTVHVDGASYDDDDE